MTSRLYLPSIFLIAAASFNAIAQKPAAPAPKPTPTPTLTEVAHDSTLVGTGTSASPLGVSASFSISGDRVTGNINAGQVNGSLTNATIDGSKVNDGSVTAAKLASVVKPLRYVDSLGNEVGVFLANGRVARYLAGADGWFELDITPGGFVDGSYNPLSDPQFMSTDCTGTPYSGNFPYVYTAGMGFFRHRLIYNGAVYYSTAEPQVLLSRSFFSSVTNSCITRDDNIELVLASSIVSVPFSDFGLAPPFRLVR